jgi:hypothetical protein
MAYMTRQQLVEKQEVQLQFHMGRRLGKMQKIAGSSNSARIRKKANRFVHGVMEVATQVEFSLMRFDIGMTDREVRDMIWQQQQAALKLVRHHRLRLKGVTGAMGKAKYVGADRVIRSLNKLRNELKAPQ